MNNIYIVGDSILKGIIYDSTACRHRFGKEMKLSELNDMGYTVTNLSKMGSTVERGYSVLTEKITGDHSGDILLLGFGGNDCDYDWDKVSSGETEGILPRTPMARFEHCYRQCIEYGKKLNMRVMCLNLVPLDDRKYFDYITKGRDSSAILSWLGDKSMLYRWHESYNQRVCRIALSSFCETVDVRSPFLYSHSYQDLMCKDGIHPTEDGYMLIKSCILNAVEKGGSASVCC